MDPTSANRKRTVLAHFPKGWLAVDAVRLRVPTDRPLYGLKKFSTIIAIHLNDLPTTSPHGSRSDTSQKICEF